MKEFAWYRLGNIEEGRSNLGDKLPVSVYRLMQYTLADVLEDTLGANEAQGLFRSAGFIAGRAFANNLLNLKQDFNSFIAELQKTLKEMSIGLLKIEKVDLQALTMTLSVAEDLDCSGLPVTGDSVCVYDEGFLSGILNAYTGKEFSVIEVDCWATGDRTCRFEVKPLK